MPWYLGLVASDLIKSSFNKAKGRSFTVAFGKWEVRAWRGGIVIKEKLEYRDIDRDLVAKVSKLFAQDSYGGKKEIHASVLSYGGLLQVIQHEELTYQPQSFQIPAFLKLARSSIRNWRSHSIRFLEGRDLSLPVCPLLCPPSLLLPPSFSSSSFFLLSSLSLSHTHIY